MDMKKYAFYALLLISLSLLSACGSDDNESTTDDSASNETCQPASVVCQPGEEVRSRDCECIKVGLVE